MGIRASCFNVCNSPVPTKSKTRAMLDSGSTINTITRRVAEKMGLVITAKVAQFTTAAGPKEIIGEIHTMIKSDLYAGPISLTVCEHHPVGLIIGNRLLKFTSPVAFHQQIGNKVTFGGEDLPSSFSELLKSLAFDPSVPLRITDHKFVLGELLDPRPVQQPLRNLPRDRKEFLVKWIQETRTLDVIEEGCIDDWTSNLTMTAHYDKNKMPKGFRICQSMISVNERFAKLPISMPMQRDIIDELSSWPWKAVIDLKLAFWYLALDPEQRKYFGFVTSFGNFRWKRAAFGFLNAPSNQQHFVNNRINAPLTIKWSSENKLRYIMGFVDGSDLIEAIRDVLSLLVELNCTVVPSSISFGTTIAALWKNSQ